MSAALALMLEERVERLGSDRVLASEDARLLLRLVASTLCLDRI